MARGLILTTQARATTTSFTTRLSVSKPKCKNPLPYRLHLPSRVSSTRFFCCKCSVCQDPIVITEYKQSFSVFIFFEIYTLASSSQHRYVWLVQHFKILLILCKNKGRRFKIYFLPLLDSF
jgi:hypothetical protein